MQLCSAARDKYQCFVVTLKRPPLLACFGNGLLDQDAATVRVSPDNPVASENSIFKDRLGF
jgi:hypothetical protein